MERVSEHVYVFRDSRRTNLGLIVCPGGPVLVDSALMPDDARSFRAAVRAVTSDPPVFLINTDHHLGHSLGNWAFPSAQTIVHRYAALYMLEKYDTTFRTRLIESFRNVQPAVAVELEGMSLPHPQLGAVDRMALHMGDFTVQIVHVGGHTPGSQMVFVPQDGVLFTGDVVVEGIYPNLADANSQQWLQALQKIADLKPKVIVPGHGGLAHADTLDRMRRYIQSITHAVGALYDSGLSRKDVVSRVKSLEGFPSETEDRARSEQRLKASLQRVYDEFKERDKVSDKD